MSMRVPLMGDYADVYMETGGSTIRDYPDVYVGGKEVSRYIVGDPE